MGALLAPVELPSFNISRAGRLMLKLGSSTGTNKTPTSHFCKRYLLSTHTTTLINYVTSCKADVFALTETWLSENDDAHRAKITPTGFKLIDHSRNNRCGGGTALLFRRNLNV